MNTPSKRVRKGVSFLNRTKPDWRGLIDLDNFDLASGENCVLGQVFEREAVTEGYDNGFFYAITEFGGYKLTNSLTWQIERGFAWAGHERFEVENNKLTAAWKRELERTPA